MENSHIVLCEVSILIFHFNFFVFLLLLIYLYISYLSDVYFINVFSQYFLYILTSFPFLKKYTFKTSFDYHNILILMKSSFSSFVVIIAFCILSKQYLPNPKLKKYSPLLFYKGL